MKKTFLNRPLLILIMLYLSFSCGYKPKSYFKTKHNKIYEINYSSTIKHLSNENIIISFPEKPKTFNPYYANTSCEFFFQKALFSCLFQINPKTGIIDNNLISEYFISQDALIYIFTLKDNIFFSNGKKLTSDDVAASLSLLQTVLKGTDIYKSFFINNEYLICKKINSLKFSIETDKPNINILYALTSFSIIPKEFTDIITDTPDYFISDWTFENWKKVTGSGPYIINSTAEDKMILSGNNYYFKKDDKNNRLPYSEKLEIKFYKDKKKQILRFTNGESDIMQIDHDDFFNLYNFFTVGNDNILFIDTNFSSRKFLMLFNCFNENSKSILKDSNMRKFISNIIFKNLTKKNKTSLLLKTTDDNSNKFDHDKNYLKKSNFYESNIIIRIVMPSGDDILTKLIKSIAEDLKKMKFNIKLEFVPYHIYLEKVFYSKEYDLTFFYYNFYQGIAPYCSILKKGDLNIYPYIIDEKNTSKIIEHQLEECINSKTISSQAENINILNNFFIDNYQFFPILYEKKYYLIKSNIYNFKLNSKYDDYFNLETIETIIKKTNF